MIFAQSVQPWQSLQVVCSNWWLIKIIRIKQQSVSLLLLLCMNHYFYLNWYYTLFRYLSFFKIIYCTTLKIIVWCDKQMITVSKSEAAYLHLNFSIINVLYISRNWCNSSLQSILYQVRVIMVFTVFLFWLILSVYIHVLMSFDFPFGRLFRVG